MQVNQQNNNFSIFKIKEKKNIVEKKVKWGVIGSGGIARRRTTPEGIMQSANAELVSVYDVDAEGNRAVAEEFNATTSGSIEALPGSDIDAVYVASPTINHLEQEK